MKITSVLIVEEIEKSLPFWVERLGFEKVVEVPEDGRAGFVILVLDGAEVMLQTALSVQSDTPQFASQNNRSALFIEVENLDNIAERLSGYPIAMAERVASYGMREIGVFEPNGHIVVFAQKV